LGPRTDCAKTRILVPHDLGHTDIPSNDLAWVWVKVNPRFVRRVTDGCIMLAHQSKKALVFIWCCNPNMSVFCTSKMCTA
jgi:hypothetical protein